MNLSSIGIDLGGTKMLIAAELNGEIVTKRFSTGINTEFRVIKNNLDNFMNDFNILPNSICVAIPGLVDGETVVECDVLPCLKGVNVNHFSDSCSVSFVNDLESALIEERNNYPNVKNLCVVMIGTGIGMAMLIDGKVCIGSNGFAGELGYTRVMTDSGMQFLDDVSAGAGILKQFGGDVSELCNSLSLGDQIAKTILKNASTYMGIGINNVISLINPEVLLIGGGTSRYENYYENLVETVDRAALPILRSATIIKRCTNQGNTVVLGALLRAKAAK